MNEKILEKRWRKVIEKYNKEGIDGYFYFSPEDIFYLTGCFVEDSLLISTKNERILLTDGRIYQYAKQKLPHIDVKYVNSATVKEACELISVHLKLGLCPSEWKLQDYQVLQGYKNINIVFCRNPLKELRKIKEKDEIENIKKATDISITAFLNILPFFQHKRSEITEREMAFELEREIITNGGYKKAFDIIVASSTNSAIPHYPTSFSPIENYTLIDWGADYLFYKSDLTRIIITDKISVYLKYMVKVVEEALDLAISLLKPGVRFSEVDKRVRNFLDIRGMEKFFCHSLGHGVGLNIHELPKISCLSEEKVEPGMVFTIEPGIYVEKVGGVRLEQIIVVNERGNIEILSEKLPLVFYLC